MISRCHNPKDKQYPRYGGRGITVCDRWRFGENGMTGLECFRADLGIRPSLKHSLERIDNEKGYEPSNVKWATSHEQARNKQTSRFITYKGETKIMQDWADQYNMHKTTLQHRLDRGWSVEEALTRPRDLRNKFIRLNSSKES